MAAGNREKRDVTRSLYSLGNLSLVPGAVSGNPAWNYLAALGYEIAQGAWILVVDADLLVCTEAADFSALKRSLFPWPAARALRTSFVTHCIYASVSLLVFRCGFLYRSRFFGLNRRCRCSSYSVLVQLDALVTDYPVIKTEATLQLCDQCCIPV